MLRACKRVLVPGGRLVFDVVSVPDSIIDHDDAVDKDRYGFVAADAPYVALLEDAGFTDIGFTDTTVKYLEVASRWLDAARDLEADLRDAMGDDVYDEKLASREASFEMAEAGEIGRTLFQAKA